MSTSSSISGENLHDIDRNSSEETPKTARAVEFRHSAKTLRIRPSQGASSHSTSDQQSLLTDSKQLRNRDCRQSSSECRSQLTSLYRSPEKAARLEVISPWTTARSQQSRPRGPPQTSKSTSKHLNSANSSSPQPGRMTLHGSHTTMPEVQGLNDGHHLSTTIRSPSSGHFVPEASTISKQESQSANRSSSSSGGHLARYSDTLKTRSPVVEPLLKRVDRLDQNSNDPDRFSLDSVATRPKTRNSLARNIFATSHCTDAAQNADDMDSPLLHALDSSNSSDGTGKTPHRSHTMKVDGSTAGSQYPSTQPLEGIQETLKTTEAEHQAILRPRLSPIIPLEDPTKQFYRPQTKTQELYTTPTTSRAILRKEVTSSDRVELLPQSLEELSLSPSSPSPWSDGEVTPEAYDTPLTSPCLSPRKSLSPIRKSVSLSLSFTQLDGGRDSVDDGVNSPLDETFSADDENSPHEDLDVLAEPDHSKNHLPIDLTEVDSQDQQPNDLDLAPEDATPLTRASKAKDAPAFPFPSQDPPRHTSSMLPAQRHPSRLLRFCERNATPRQQRLMAGTLESPDRFIPARTATPNKDALLFRRPAKRRIDPRQRLPPVNGLPDPFGPSPSRTARMSDRYTTTRTPSAPQRSVSLSGTAVPDAISPSRRAVSSGAIWTVGGTTVTEGIASITNGRGGRVTSGTSAPHYTADFLRRQSPSEDEIQHGLRLAAAMEVQPSARMINHSSPHSTPSPTSPRRSSCSNIGLKRTVWNNNAWEKSSPSTPSKPPKKKTKDIPVIPFRVLDAPALRDDYYCSLLAYSPTAQCLAVGLGPHVYLWSEARGTTPTHIPDSLTAPFGAHVTSVSFSSVQGGKSILAIGRANGRITLWSPQDRDPRFDSEQPAPVSCVSFRPTTVVRPSVREPSMTVTTEELLVGDEVGNVYYYSIEWPSPDDRDLFGWHGSMTLLARMSCHTQQICGIAWSKDGDLFATGGNDNQLLLFDTKKLFAKGRNHSANQPSTVRVRNGSSQGSDNVAGQGGVTAITPGQHKHLFTLNAAVKAIAFAPWQSSLLAAGGGSNDRCIHFFHALSGATLATIDCHAQVTSLVWSSKRKEIAATFGFAQPDHPYRVAVFSWPSCQRVVGIPWWSEERALYAVAYPGGPSGGPTTNDRRRQVDAEGRPWHGRRTRDEGCLVIATSNASIKFHEIWPEKIEKRGREGLGGGGGLLGGSVILEDGVSLEMEMQGAIR